MPKITVLAGQLSEQPALLKRFHGEFPDLKKVSVQLVARVQTEEPLTKRQANHIHDLLLESKGEKISQATISHGHVFEIAYRPAVLDPEHTAVRKILKTAGLDELVQAVKMSTVSVFEGITEDQAKNLVRKYLFNDLMQVFVHEEPETLTIGSQAEPVHIIEDFRDMNLRELKELSEQRSWYMEDSFLLETQRKFKEDLQRDPTDAELEYLAQRTSDHCFHTTWKSLGLFKRLKEKVAEVLPKRPDIVSVFVDNSGVIAADGENTYFIKGETHNSPTAIAPVGGVETMHGGCIRDIMGTGQGGYPTMATQVFIVGSQSKEEMAKDYNVDGFLDPLVILRGAIDGVQNYGNAMGIANFGGRVFTHPKFFGKPLALGICIGLGQKNYSKKGTPVSGDIALLIGNPTGRDGIHGATMSSAANTEETLTKEGAAVQIGDPYTERLIMEATPDLRPLMRAYGDLGAGGIASCFGEMAEGVGIEIDLEKIPTKYEGLSPWEKLESESQERMGMAVAPQDLEAVKKILQFHEIPYHELGKFTDSNRFVVKHGTETIVDLDYEWLEHFPVPNKDVGEFFPRPEEVHLSPTGTLEKELLRVLQNPDLADQSLFARRWDGTVQGKTLRESLAPFTNMPHDQGILVPDPGSRYGQVLSLTINPWWAGNPEAMTRACFAGTVSKQIAAGVSRKKIAMCDNFYTPKSQDEIDFYLTKMVEVMTDMMVELETPIISGKDSSSGTSKIPRHDGGVDNFEVVPTLCMSAIGVHEDISKVPAKAFQKAGNGLYFIPSGIQNDASGSVLLESELRQKYFNYEINVKEYRQTIDRLAHLIYQEKIKSISVVDDGGMFHRLFEMMLGSGLGVELKTLTGEGILEALTKALPGSFIVEVAQEKDLIGIDTLYLGDVIAEPELRIGGMRLELKKMKEAWMQTWHRLLHLPQGPEEIETPEQIIPFRPSARVKKMVNVLYTPGTNDHREMLRAWELLGCKVSLISATDPFARFADADIVVFPGGFADGDYLGAAKVWNEVMNTQFKSQMNFLKKGNIPVLGICNGFQLMTRSGFFGKNIRLIQNDSMAFEHRWVKLRFTEDCGQSIWTKGLEGQEICVPVAHGFGKFVMEDEMDTSTIAMKYDPDVYPNNPNGSRQAIAGVFAGSRGQFFGSMPHPERAIEDFHYSQHGLLLFENLLRNL
ncbi:MAG: phosphoribosylformylglycinamidine synthase subunit PurQ [bacterium]|nr:phosphoribosylformylglycinamidine synthase subunit PurQ [bacterium]